MDLKKYLSTLGKAERAELADGCKTTAGHLQNIAYGFRITSPELCVQLEQKTRGEVTRQELRPDDWQAIWPELSEPAAEKQA